MIDGAYGVGAEGLPLENLNEVAVVGPCFVQKQDPFFGRGEDDESAIVTSRTWLQLCRLASDMIQTTGDLNHVFLEAVSELREENGGKVFRVEMGS